MTGQRLLEVSGLTVSTRKKNGTALVDNLSLTLDAGECLGLVGESGSGKSLTLRSILGLLPNPLAQTAGTIKIADGTGGLVEQTPSNLRGNGISMVFQEPMSSLNPTIRIGNLVAAGARARGLSRADSAALALQLLDEVGIPDAAKRLRSWPHELSGGLRQRVMIAMALSAEPKLLLCDEPTTALDATVQDQILTLLERLRKERNLAVIFVSHDLAVISRIADRTSVMYAGMIVEDAATSEIISRPRHPYTQALANSMPSTTQKLHRLPIIPGTPPTAGQWDPGCRFAPRCEFATAACLVEKPPLLTVAPAHESACIRDRELFGAGTLAAEGRGNRGN